MIAVDVMGGDFAPGASLEGSLAAARKNIPVLLCGPEELLKAKLDDLDPAWRSYPISFVHTSEVIDMGEEAVKAVMAKPASSLVAAVKSVQQGKAVGCISAGNSGAFMAAATFVLGRNEGVERPAIAGFMPSLKHPVLCLDLGANVECKPHYLVTFARMGVAHLSLLRGEENIRVGLLANGSEEGKGSPLGKAAYPLLREAGINFIGNVEPLDIFMGNVDVVVCDGFSGNILLKTAEAASHMIMKVVFSSIKELGLGAAATNAELKNSPLMDHLKKRMEWNRSGGALLLGVKGTVVVAHGASNAQAIESAIEFAFKSSTKKL